MNPLRSALRFHRMRSSWLGSGGSPVPSVQAQHRANVCLSCPLNRSLPWWEFLAAPAVVLVKKQLTLKDGMSLKVEGEDRLHTCEACLCQLKLKVHTPTAHILATTDLDGLHPACWIRSEKLALDAAATPPP